MKIDLEMLESAIDDVYAAEAERIDKNEKNDQVAIRRLTMSETRQIKDGDVIRQVKELAQRIVMLCRENHFDYYDGIIIIETE